MSIIQQIKSNPVTSAVVSGIIVSILLSVFLLSKIVTEVISWTEPNTFATNTITVLGEGEETAVPDVATFSFTVMETGATPEAAQNLATAKSNEAITLLRNNGIDEKDIKTTSYNSYPQYEERPCTAFDCPPRSNEISGYQVSQSVSVKVRNSDDAGRILAELGRVGVSNISGISFSIDDDEKYYEIAREKAIQEAKEEAKKLAKNLEVKLGKIISFSDNHSQPYYGGAFDSVRTLEAVSKSTPELPTGENMFKANVSITYEIK